MAGNTFGQAFRVTTFGESHGIALGAIVDGCPPGLEISEADLQVELDRRRPGQSRYTTQRKESDTVRILSGVFEGQTTGTAIGLLIENEDQKSKDYSNIAEVFRPAHADFTYHHKYGLRDYRGGGRASARETTMRVAAGAIARKFLASLGVQIQGYLSAVGEIELAPDNLEGVYENEFFSPQPERDEEIAALIDQLRREGNSIGAEVSVLASGVPVGLGEPVFGKIDAELAGALMGINAVKAVQIGDGVDVVRQRGTEHRDEMTPEGFTSNHAGGVLGGITSGQDLFARVALKPTSSLTTPGRSVNTRNEAVEVVTKGRHDPCVGIRAVPIVEAMVALVLMDHVLRHRGQVGRI